MKAFIAINRKKPLACEAASKLRDIMRREGVTEVLGADESDVIFTLGGDGTILANIGYGKPVLGINLGHLGYLTALVSDELPLAVKYSDGKTFETTERMMLDVTVERDGKCVYSALALNEAVVTRGAAPLLVDMKLYFGDRFITTHSADGLIVATPTGSTAYSMSAGGPVVDPGVDALIVTPVCSHNPAKSHAVVIPSDTVITIIPQTESDTGICISVDGKSGIYLCRDDVVRVRVSEKRTLLVKKTNNSFGGLPYIVD